MKKLFFILIVALSSVNLALANITLKSSDAFSLVGAITEKASENGLINAELYKKQTFDIVEDGKKLGTLIQGKGWMRDVHPVCFVGWAKNSQHIDYFMETIGVGDWETADCIVVRLLKMILITNNQKLKNIVETF